MKVDTHLPYLNGDFDKWVRELGLRFTSYLYPRETGSHELVPRYPDQL